MFKLYLVCLFVCFFKICFQNYAWVLFKEGKCFLGEMLGCNHWSFIGFRVGFLGHINHANICEYSLSWDTEMVGNKRRCHGLGMKGGSLLVLADLLGKWLDKYWSIFPSVRLISLWGFGEFSEVTFEGPMEWSCGRRQSPRGRNGEIQNYCYEPISSLAPF